MEKGMEYAIHRQAVDRFYCALNDLETQMTDQDKILIFGTNKVSGMMAYYLKEKGRQICGFIDNDVTRQGKEVFGLPIYAPEQKLKPFDDTYRILIVSGHQDSMVKQLEQLGYTLERHIKIVIDLNKEMQDFSFADRRGYVELTEDEIRQGQLRVLKHLKEVCEKHQLRYYLAGGTLLGAVRHQGFIPWDDDIDVFVELEDLKKLNEIMKEDKDYSLLTFVDEESEYCDEYTLLVEHATIMDNNHFPIQLTTGISIDISYLSGIPDGEEELSAYAQKAKELEQIKWNKLYSREECKKATKDVVAYLSQYKFGATKRVGSVLSPHYLREVFQYESFAKPTQVLFEGEYYSAPSDYDAYLTQLYGKDYMTPPPEPARDGHHSFKVYHRK